MIPDQNHRPQRPKPRSPLLPLAVAAVVIAATAWWFVSGDKPPSAPADVSSPAPAPAPQPLPEAVEQAPDIPFADPLDGGAEQDSTPLLPALGDSDGFSRDALSPLSADPEFALWLSTDNLVQKAVAVVDGLSRGNILRKILPVQPPAGSFQAIQDGDRIVLDEGNYARHTPLVNLLTAIPPAALAQAFHTLRPLLEQAFAELGNPGDKIDNSLIAAIDQVLATPEVDEPIALKRESVLFQFADPELEALPDVQKQLLRIGPDNRARIKGHLATLRQELLNPGSGESN